jgi:hypothetical protein
VIGASAVIDHLRLRRNDIVHKSSVFQDAESLVFQLKAIVEGLIRQYYGTFSREFSSKNEVITFLDMPCDAKMLRLEKRFIQN